MGSIASRTVEFSPPDIGQDEIDEVVDTLKSGWITTGPKTKRFEAELAKFTGAARVACTSAATTALECALRMLGIGPGDEVITSAYTYTASASPICHVGATPVLVDTAPGSFMMDPAGVAAAITPRTRAVIPVDIAGVMYDYDTLEAILDDAAGAWSPRTDLQSAFSRIPIVADAAHSLGATYHGHESGSVADFSTFSFHAVKNLTTAEGGAIAWRENPAIDNDDLYRDVMLFSLHGQTKDALSKTRAGAWEYDVAFPGYKCNMTDIQASLGLAQLRRYPAILNRRHEIVRRYRRRLAGFDIAAIPHISDEGTSVSSAHLMLVRLLGKSSEFRNALIELMGEEGVAANVHYKPLPLLSAYRNLGFRIEDFPNAYAQFENEVTLPLHTKLTDEDVDYVCESFALAYRALEAEGVR